MNGILAMIENSHLELLCKFYWKTFVMKMKDFFDFMRLEAYPTIQTRISDIGPK